MSYSTNQHDPREDGYVECTECGHRVEDHHLEGCLTPECTCPEKFTRAEIYKIRRAAGLPARFDRTVFI